MGLRSYEIANIKNSDINFDYNSINLSSKFMFNNRTLEIPKFLRPYLIKQFENSKQDKQNMLFYNYTLPQSQFILKKVFKNKLGINRNISAYMLRATYIQRYIENKQNICNIEKIIGARRLPSLLHYPNFKEMNINDLLNYYEKNIQKNEYNKQFILSKTKKINKEIFSTNKNKLTIQGKFDDLNYGKTILLKDRYTINAKKQFETLEETKAFLQGIRLLNDYTREKNNEYER